MTSENAHNEGFMETQGDRMQRLIERAYKIDAERGKPHKERMSQSKLAVLLGGSRGLGNQWRKSDDIKLYWLRRMAKFFQEEYGFNVTVEWLQGGDKSGLYQAPDPDMLTEIAKTIADICEEEKWTPPSMAVCHEIIYQVYEAAMLRGEPPYDKIRRLLRLTQK